MHNGETRMEQPPSKVSARVLSPVDRISEIIFGLIMALTFTGALSAATADREEVRVMLIGAIGCNIAWGLVDAVMYLVTRLTEQGRALLALRSVLDSNDATRSRQTIAEAMPPLIAGVMQDSDLETIRRRLKELPAVPRRATLKRDDWLGALAVFLVVCLSTFPVVVPFLFMTQPVHALRVSNAIAVVMLFLCGCGLGSYAGKSRWLMGITMAVLGSVLVAITIALGG